MEIVYTHAYPTAWGTFFLASTKRGLCNITFPGKGEDFRGWLQRQFGEGLVMEPDVSRHDEVGRQLREYLEGRRKEFDLPLHLIGTDFQKKVWRALRRIPYGDTWTYLEIADRVGVGHAGCRAVGGAVGQNPIPIVIPCHRVIGKDGSLTGFGGGLELKERLLVLEGALETSEQEALNL
jgi:O-6-methylguanine DNA methyltransferase